ncbi:MAG: DUF3500 domain-containing protein [Bryobacteraceae bacterium]
MLTSAYVRIPAHQTMAQAANHFLESLTPEQRAKAVFKFDEDERLNWHFIPRVRKGLPLREMTSAQKHLATALLSAGLSQKGFIKASTVMSLEDVLRIQEKDNGDRRNPEGYYFSIFGEPGDKGVWGYRVEGHHLAQNYTVVAGKVVDTPMFYGANPAEVRQGSRKGLRVLAGEEDLARELMTALDAGQKKAALVDATAYKDILTAASRKASLDGQPSGLHASKLNSKQFAMLMAVVEEYANNLPDQLAQARLEQVKKAGKNLHFAWAGVVERGGPHYYRVHAPGFLIEYDNVQNDGNHIHSVWRDFNGDFGLDLLKAHYQTSHR